MPQAILFDLLNGGDKGWGTAPLYERLARSACDAAATCFALGSAGAGLGATTATLRGGLGSASEMLDGGMIVGAIVAANPVGSAIVGNSPHFWAAPFEQGEEFGGLGPARPYPADALALRLKGVAARSNTTLGVVATNVCLDKRQLQRIAIMAQTGLARAIYPVHTPLDGDVVFALSTGEIALPDPIAALTRLGAAAANTLARAVARGIYHASPAPSFWTGPPAYATLFPPTRVEPRASHDATPVATLAPFRPDVSLDHADECLLVSFGTVPGGWRALGWRRWHCRSAPAIELRRELQRG